MKGKKTVLIILDGWGHGDKTKSDAIHNAKTPFVDYLYTKYKYLLENYDKDLIISHLNL